jgi:hypothetical protein
MATITLTEILGSDNIAGSRITINDNFKKVANSINTIETYLDTSFTPGASLNIGSALVKKYTRPITDQIFTCEATGLFSGNLNIGQDVGVTRDIFAGRHATVNGNVTFTGTVGTTSIFSSAIPLSLDSAIISPQFYAAIASNSLVIDPQTLTIPATTASTRRIPTTASFKKVSVIFTGAGTNNCYIVELPAVSDSNVGQGQIITVLVDVPAPTSTTGYDFAIATGVGTTTDPTYTSVLFNDSGAGVEGDDSRLRQAAITFFADDSGWRILHAVGATVVIS